MPAAYRPFQIFRMHSKLLENRWICALDTPFFSKWDLSCKKERNIMKEIKNVFFSLEENESFRCVFDILHSIR